jgi:phosphoribosylamine--glycine ligase
MVTAEGPKLIEYNVRFGDPDSQVVLLRATSDLSQLLAEAASGRIRSEPTFAEEAAVLVVAMAEGYPGPMRTGDPIEGLDRARRVEGVEVLAGGVALDEDGRLVTAGGRVLDVVGRGSTAVEARRCAYRAVAELWWPGLHHRTDIAAQAAEEVGR